MNRCFYTEFWGHTFYDWDDIVLPNLKSEHFIHGDALERTMFQGISLDYRRFMSDSILDCFRLEYDAIKKKMPNVPITTNLMGFFKDLDYQKWAREMDFVSWDSYPEPLDSPAAVAMRHDLMRGIKGQQSFVLMEQTPSVTNWHHYNKLKRPGDMRLLSLQAAAHGADAIQFFQIRRSRGACEKYHGAVIDHAGREDTRVFLETAALGKELSDLKDSFLEGRTPSETAIVFDWDNWWAVEYSAGPSVLMKYLDAVKDYYTAAFEQNVPVDIISVEDDMLSYKVVIAPLLYMTKTGYAKKVNQFVKQGGIFITTYFSGIVDEHDLVLEGGYPGELKDVLGIWVEENDALPEGESNSFIYDGVKYPAAMLCDLMHLENGQKLSEYEEDFYKGTPVLTMNHYGKGAAYYVGTRSDAAFYRHFLKNVFDKAEVLPVMNTPEGVEAAVRVNDKGRTLFLLNHTRACQMVVLDRDYCSLVDGKEYKKGDSLELGIKGVVLLRG